MNVSRNDPCPCGSGKKYKKCCLAQDQNAASEAREQRQAVEQAEREKRQAEEADFLEYATALEELSNRANDLTRAEQWPDAEACCRELLERFSDEIDGHHRSYECYKAKGDFVTALTHAQATLALVESREGFDPCFPARLKQDIARFEDLIQSQRSND